MKEVFEYKDVRERILSGIDKVCNPIIGTLTPKGQNVIFEVLNKQYRVANDGMTIASQIELEDPVENAVADIVRKSAMRTNHIAGDGTTTSMLLTQHLIKEGFKLIDSGWNQMSLKRELDKVGEIISKEIQKAAKKVKTKQDIFFIAQLSANNDKKIADDVMTAIESAGEEGLILLEENAKYDVELVKDLGFLISQGMFSPHFTNQAKQFSARYDNVKVFLTDKRIYYPDECIAILEPIAKAGIKDVVIVAKDFIGQAPNIFIANHIQKKMNILLVKDPDLKDDNDITSLEDLADYLGCKVFTDKAGKLTTKDVTLESFGTADKVVSLGVKTLLLKEKSIQRMEKITKIRNAISNAENEAVKERLEKRLSRMTSGTVTIKVGGNTPAEAKEKVYRYEDAINSARIAKKDGYIVGGGITLHNVYKRALKGALRGFDDDLVKALERVCNAPLRQIAINCGENYKTLLENVENGFGYNAATDKYEDLLKAGIIEPTKVLQLAFENAISAAGTILSSNYFILEKEKEKDGKDEK